MPTVRRWSWVIAGEHAQLASLGDGVVVASLSGSHGRIGDQALVVRRSPDAVRLWSAATSHPIGSVTTDWAGRGTVRLPTGRSWAWVEGAGVVDILEALSVRARAGAGSGIGDVEVVAGLAQDEALVLATLGLARLAGAAAQPGAVVRSGAPRSVRSVFRT